MWNPHSIKTRELFLIVVVAIILYSSVYFRLYKEPIIISACDQNSPSTIQDKPKGNAGGQEKPIKQSDQNQPGKKTELHDNAAGKKAGTGEKPAGKKGETQGTTAGKKAETAPVKRDTAEFLPPMECGTGWQEKYALFHKRTLAGKNNGRVLVSVAVEGGLADNLSGLMTEFYLAYFSKRALQVYHYGFLPRYEPAFQPSYFNWTNPGYPDILTDNLKYTYMGERGYEGDRSYPPEVNTTENWYIYQMNDLYEEKDWMFGTQNLRNRVPRGHTNAKRVFMMSNRGMTYLLGSKNPHHMKELKEMGLRPESMFGCAFRAIFKPTELLVKRIEGYMKVLRDPRILKIGIMIRTGDASFNSTSVAEFQKYKYYTEYFECAQRIENEQRKDNQQVIWYLISDSLELRRTAKILYGPKILTDVETQLIHPDCAAHDPETCSHDLMRIAMMQAAGQLLNFAWTDFQVITTMSGFGRAGAVLGSADPHIYSIPRDVPCISKFEDPWEWIATDWAGI